MNFHKKNDKTENSPTRSSGSMRPGEDGISDIDAGDLFLHTDARAIQEYKNRGALDKLEHDIKFSVRRGEEWQRVELEYAAEVHRLEQEGILERKGTYWFISPHPPVYIAPQKGSIILAGRQYRFKKGDDLTFQCRMAREENNLPAPVLIGKFFPTENTHLCGEMSGTMKGTGGKEGKDWFRKERVISM